MRFTHEISFSGDIEEQFGINARAFGLCILSQHIAKFGINTDRPLTRDFVQAAKHSNSGLLLKATLLPNDIFYLRERGFDVTPMRAPLA